jgi:hypothetical protein
MEFLLGVKLGSSLSSIGLFVFLHIAALQLDRKVVDLAELRRLACQGVPDAAGIRPIVWKVRGSPHDLLNSLRNCIYTLTECFSITP